MHKRLFLIVFGLLQCIMGKVSAQSGSTEDRRFDEYKGTFIESLWVLYPTWASSIGYHKYDGVLIVPDAASRTKELKFCTATLDSLKKFLWRVLILGSKRCRPVLNSRKERAEI